MTRTPPSARSSDAPSGTRTAQRPAARAPEHAAPARDSSSTRPVPKRSRSGKPHEGNGAARAFAASVEATPPRRPWTAEVDGGRLLDSSGSPWTAATEALTGGLTRLARKARIRCRTEAVKQKSGMPRSGSRSGSRSRFARERPAEMRQQGYPNADPQLASSPGWSCSGPGGERGHRAARGSIRWWTQSSGQRPVTRLIQRTARRTLCDVALCDIGGTSGFHTVEVSLPTSS